MQKLILLLTLGVLSIIYLIVKAQDFTESDKIRGQWYTEENKSLVEIYRAKNGKYYGKIVWLKNPLETNGKPKVDDENPDPAKRNDPIIGLVLLKGFDYKGEGVYKNGTIYDPDNGKTYDCIITFANNDKLFIRGYIGISLIGRTTEWIRKK